MPCKRRSSSALVETRARSNVPFLHDFDEIKSTGTPVRSGGPVEPRGPMADRAQALVAAATAPFVDKLRGMTPLDVDTAVGAIFAVCAVVLQIALFVLARAITKALAAGTKPAAAEKDSPPSAKPATPAVTVRVERVTPVEAEVSGFAWMRAAGITPHDAASSDPGTPPGAARPGGAPNDLAPDTPGTPGAPPSPLSPSSRPSAHYSKLTPAELQRLREFRALVQKAARDDPALLGTSDLKRFANDACLCRYLRARSWNLKKALKMFSATARWRAKTRPERIKWRDVQAEGATGKQYLAGTDKEGRNVLVMRPGRENTKEHAGNIRFLEPRDAVYFTGPLPGTAGGGGVLQPALDLRGVLESHLAVHRPGDVPEDPIRQPEAREGDQQNEKNV